MEIAQIEKIDNSIMIYTYENGETFEVGVIPINTRAEAIEKCIYRTKLALRKNSAFERLHKFTNNFDRFRNYEIENYLEFITGYLGYRIIEKCPFNGFSWFDGTGKF